jgi:glycosyltransferase involved in cell wall biosynthesis
LKAISILPNEILNQIHFILVGREGKATNLLLEQVKENNLSDYITFLGHRTDIPQLLNMSDVFVFPSRFEGLPGVLIEAEASGLPIVCTDLPMMLEVVEKDKNALVFEIDDYEELAQAIQKIAIEKNLRTQFSTKSKEIFQNKFQIETVHQKMLDLYKTLLIQ